MNDSLKNPSQFDHLKHQFYEGKLAPCYLFYGAPGAGQIETAFKLGTCVLSKNDQNPYAFNAETTQKYIQQRVHPNFFILQPAEIGEEIVMDDARALMVFLRGTPSIPGWRFVIIHAADDFNNSAGNSLLKILEELPAKVTVVMVSYCLVKVKKTLISRAQKIFFKSERDPVSEYIQTHDWTKEIEHLIPVGFKKAVTAQHFIETIGNDSEKIKWFSQILLHHLHRFALQELRSESSGFYARQYAEISDFINLSEGKALAPAHWIQALCLLLNSNPIKA